MKRQDGHTRFRDKGCAQTSEGQASTARGLIQQALQRGVILSPSQPKRAIAITRLHSRVELGASAHDALEQRARGGALCEDAAAVVERAAQLLQLLAGVADAYKSHRRVGKERGITQRVAGTDA